ncbi:MAG: bifunctional folylpolyglutamate synthase/dihydrofolate synthase [Armatimonadetes bacterium]|nr:bifunctional folylpolyglutamate synthase/dihydrofolate synthase [Armatimonadota bacterium]
MEYEEAMEYLQNLTKFGFNFGLGRIRELLRRLGNPHLSLRVIHIGGTNGKGSTLAMVASILRAAGYKTGTFTSPHLHSYTERYIINGRPISRRRVAQLITGLRPHLDGMVAEGFEHPTEFEVGTALAFQYFFEEQVDFLVLEVGLGGAIDSTNVVERPLVSVITNVAMDHMDYLGRTVREIAAVKAGIIKGGVPVITAADDPEALAVIGEVAREKQAPFIGVLDAGQKTVFPFDRQVRYQLNDFSLAGQHLTVRSRQGSYENLFLPLPGRHQLANAATAVAVTEVLIEKGYGISREAVYRGMANTFWPARLEIFPGEPLVVIDGAHNYAGAKSLRRAWDDYFPGRGIILVLGMLGDKERARVVQELAPRARAVVVTKPASPRAQDWQSMAAEARRHVREVYAIEAIREAVVKALRIARREEVVCITGSLYMVAEAREMLLNRLDRGIEDAL